MWKKKLGCLALLSVACAGCGANSPPPSQPKQASDPITEPVSEAREPETASKAEPEAGSGSDDPKTTEPATPDQGKWQRPLEQLCAQVAARAAERCNKRVAEFYATNCRRYVKAAKCEAEITRMLECQVKTSDELLCAHQADPNCAEVNHQLLACDKGKAPIEQIQPEDLTLPSGWASIQDSKLGFTVAMPEGATLEENGSKRSWKAEEGGITYIAESTEPPVGKPTSAALLRTIMKYLGSRCQLQLKVRGEFELKGVTVVQYESGCTDGTTWRGMMHVWNGNAVSTGFRGPKGSRGVVEPYFFSFALTK